MRKLYHFSLCPFSRLARIMLQELHLEVVLVREPYWEERQDFTRINPASEVPVLVDEDGSAVCNILAICEYIDEKHASHRSFYGAGLLEKAETRRIMMWFYDKCYREAVEPILREKILNFMQFGSAPDSATLRKAKRALQYHLDYISFLVQQHSWLSGEKMTLADLMAAAQISVLDYLGDIRWQDYPHVKEWYQLIKSRPSFRGLLSDGISGFVPPRHYEAIDF